MQTNKILNLLREFEEKDPANSKDVYQYIKENGLLMMSESFKKKCVGIMDASSLKEQDYEMWSQIGQIDGIDSTEEGIETYLDKNSGKVIIQLADDQWDIYSPSQKAIDEYTETCNSNDELKEKTSHLKGIEFKSKGDKVVPMFDLEELKTLGFKIKKNGLTTSWGIQHPEENNHHYGSYVAIENEKEDVYLVAKDSKGLPLNYEKI